MIKVVITDFSRTVLFPKVPTDTHEMNKINRKLIASALGKPPEEVTDEELKRGAQYYRADEYFTLNQPLLDQFQLLKDRGVESLQIFTSGFVQNHGDLQARLSIFDKIFNVEQNGDFKKTDPQAYTNIINTLRVQFPDLDPTEILFVDDEIGNIEAAKEAGMTTYLFPKYDIKMTIEEFFDNAAEQFKAFVDTELSIDGNQSIVS